jgi:predicted RNA-binding Zn-ribbon protein involved in translation (DUF1610 family)
MTSSTAERTRRVDRSVWTCPNCRQQTGDRRKRCRDCGTSRH